MKKVRWGVLGVAKIAVTRIIPAMQAGRVQRDRGHRVARQGAGRGGGARARHSQGLRLLRGDAGRSGDRRGLQSAAQSPAPAVVHARRRGRQARALRKADRPEPEGSARTDGGARPHRRQDRRSLHGAEPPAVAADRGTGARRTHRATAFRGGHVQLFQARRRQHTQHPRVRRRRAVRYRLLSHQDVAHGLRRGAATRFRRHHPRSANWTTSTC